MKIGVLIINLGTPDDPSVLSVQRYLRQFLRDPRVIDLPALLRYILVYGIIVPSRSLNSAHAYQSIWGEHDSPLRVITQQTATALTEKLGDGYEVAYAMRYGKPAIADVVQTLRQCQELIVIPLFPQYSSAATGSAMACVFSALSKLWNIPKTRVLNSFYDHPGYIQACADVITTHLPKDDFLLFSYHGLPQRHIEKSECTKQCGGNPCPISTNESHYCYRRQCYVTTEKIVQILGLKTATYASSFQSRLGKTPWIKPYTDEILNDLRQKGITKLSVVSPSFVADCLETLEEINIRLKKQWLEMGGESFTYIPCINNNPLWIDALCEFVTHKE